MNLSEKRYTVNRAFDIVVAAAQKLAKPDFVEQKRVQKVLKIKQSEIIDMLSNGELPRLSHKKQKDEKVQMYNTNFHVHLTDFFDFSEIENRVNTIFSESKISKEAVDRTGSWERLNIEFQCPLNSNLRKKIECLDERTQTEIEDLKILLTQTADAIMIGSHKEARDALANLEETLSQ